MPHRLTLMTVPMLMTPVGFEPTQLALVELESTPLDHSGKVSWWLLLVVITMRPRVKRWQCT